MSLLLGVVLLSIPLLALFYMTARAVGVMAALGAWAFSTITTGMILLGIKLILGGLA